MPEPQTIKLTQKQENFVNNIFLGMSQFEAYKSAGYGPATSRATIDVNASQLINQPKIQARLAELRNKAADASIMTVKERRQRLSEFGREDIRNSAGTLIRHGSIAAMDLLNKMDGDYAPQKVDLTEGLTELLGQLRGRMVPEIGQTGQDAGDGEK